jgi:hypothetical protein
MQTTPHEITPEMLQAFLERREIHAAAAARRRRDGMQETLSAIEQGVETLAGSRPG